MKTKLRVLAIMMASLLAVASFSACSNNTTDKDDSSSNSNSADSGEKEDDSASDTTYVAGEVNKYGWLVPEKTLEFTAAYGQGTPSEYEADWEFQLNVLKEQFNIDMDPTVWETDYTERLSLMLATSDYPDVVGKMNTTQLAEWLSAGIALDLAPIIDESVPEIKESMGSYYNRYLEEDGALYNLPDMWGYWGLPGYAPAIRNDWLKEVDEARFSDPAEFGRQFSSPEEFTELMAQMVANHPTGADGNTSYALGFYNSTEAFLNFFNAMWGMYNSWSIDEDMNLTHWSQTEEGLAQTLWLNDMYRKGLLDPDSFSQTADELKSKYANERYAGWVGSWWQPYNYGHEQWKDLRDDWTDEQRYVHVDVYADGLEHSTMSPISTNGYYRTIITDQAEDKAADILKLLQYQMTPEGMRFFGWGVAGPDNDYAYWNIDEDGNWEWNQEIVDLRLGEVGFDHDLIESRGTMSLNLAIRLGDEENDIAGYADTNWSYEGDWRGIFYAECSDNCWDNAYLTSIYIDPTDDLSITKQLITDLSTSGWAKAVTAASEEECIATFEQMAKDIVDAGVADYQGFYTSEYQRLYTAWN